MTENQNQPKEDNFLIGLNSKGEKFTEENIPWYRDENGKIVFKKQLSLEDKPSE